MWSPPMQLNHDLCSSPYWVYGVDGRAGQRGRLGGNEPADDQFAASR